MAEGVDNLVLEQLRPIRSDLGEVKSRLDTMEGKLDDADVKMDGLTAVVIGLGKYIHDIDGRVEHLEEKIGG